MNNEPRDIRDINAEVADLLLSTREQIKDLYSQHPDSAMLSINVDTTLNSLANRINRMNGDPAAIKTAPPAEYPPVTNFMGTTIEYRKGLTAADIENTPTETQTYEQKVDTLYNAIQSLDSSTVAKDYSRTRMDEAVLRGVGKRANMLNYDSLPLNAPYVDAVKEAIDKLNKEDLLKEQAEETLRRQLAKDYEDKNKVLLTDLHFVTYPQLTSLGLKTGDSVDKSILEGLQSAQQPPAPTNEANAQPAASTAPEQDKKVIPPLAPTGTPAPDTNKPAKVQTDAPLSDENNTGKGAKKVMPPPAAPDKLI